MSCALTSRPTWIGTHGLNGLGRPARRELSAHAVFIHVGRPYTAAASGPTGACVPRLRATICMVRRGCCRFPSSHIVVLLHHRSPAIPFAPGEKNPSAPRSSARRIHDFPPLLISAGAIEATALARKDTILPGNRVLHLYKPTHVSVARRCLVCSLFLIRVIPDRFIESQISLFFRCFNL
jgi:hypothetical protein